MRFHSHRTHSDFRRNGAYDIVPGLPGDINFTFQYPKIIPQELHMHKRQTDFFTVALGAVLFLLKTDGGKEHRVVLRPKDHKTLIISAKTWHAYIALEPSILIFYISHKYDPKDEFRKRISPKTWERHLRAHKYESIG